MSAFQYFSFSPLTLLPLAWLWFRLIDHLRVEWSVNPQYAYGWAVPFLCLYLLWGKIESRKQKVESRGGKAEILKAEMLKSEGQSGGGEAEILKAESRKQKAESSGQGKAASPSPVPVQSSGFEVQGSKVDVPPAPPSSASRSVVGFLLSAFPISALNGSFSLSAFQLFSFCLLAFLYLPTRLIQEANPEWRLVSWALAFEVIGITLLLLRTIDYGPRTTHHVSRFTFPTSHPPFQLSAFSFSDFVFPLCFFLVAVPWPTIIEGPLIQGLMRANVGATVQLLGAVGIPAMQHGNVIELSTGVVGIDDACSGIRSFQATLMISLFLGELYALSAKRRALCVLAGFALAFVFNVGRTLLLAWVAAAKGIGAIASWHDPAGVTILVACFVSLWMIARALCLGKADILKAERLKSVAQGGPASASQHFSISASQYFSICLAAWLLLVEGGTELWYRSHEWYLPRTTVWHVEFPRDNPTFRELPFADRTRQILRYDEGLNGLWQEPNGTRWQAIFFRWKAGRTAAHLAKSHTPEVCLTAAGRELISHSQFHSAAANGLRLVFQSYVFTDASGPLHVFYCLWEDHVDARFVRMPSSSYASRVAAVLAGRRNSGQRSLEVAIWGMASQTEADAALARELDKLIKAEK